MTREELRARIREELERRGQAVVSVSEMWVGAQLAGRRHVSPVRRRGAGLRRRQRVGGAAGLGRECRRTRLPPRA